MVFEVESRRAYIYQPEQKVITYAGRSSKASMSEFVVFRQMIEEGLYLFERRDKSTFMLPNLKHIFSYQYEVPHKRGRGSRYE